ncbi:hypothetical protein [Sphingomonas sp. Leaf17]|uniref:hypothetical protein n=1 Tax=Sphingomonas sp. Leaf17 TaxID=1735683 RepID=UPI0009E6EF0B|nr:hypothetical protein [Sphingomonas sp. Leaf17]
MVAYSRLRLNAAIPPAGGIAAAVIVALVFAFLPQDMLEDWTWNSGIAALVPVAQPPLGITARAVLALGFGIIAAAVVWSSLYLLFGPGGVFAPRAPAADGVPVLRRADSHPDAPARRPISAAADFGDPVPTPVLPPVPPLVRDLPDDLDQPLAAYDPHAILPAPREPVRPVGALIARPSSDPVPEADPPVAATPEPAPPLPITPPPRFAPPTDAPAPVSEPRVAIKSVETDPAAALRIEPEARPDAPASAPPAPLPVPSTPAAGSPSVAIPADDSPPSIEALLARLERGARRRSDAPRPSIDEALGTLRGVDRAIGDRPREDR